jgi:hypothetical protein
MALPKLFVRLTDIEREKLIERARLNRRHPSDEAAIIVASALAKAEQLRDESAIPAGAAR